MDENGQAQSAGEAFLRLLASREVTYLFVNSGTDFPTIVEAVAHAYEVGFSIPKTLLVPHENVAVGMAYGVTLVTGQAQAVMIHVNVGTANALCGLINASRENIPMLMAAGRTPWLEKGSKASRTLNIHWAQEMFDQASMVREHVKWDYELRDGSQMASVLDRALAIAHAQPQGPVYLSLPREVLVQDCPSIPNTTTKATPLPAEPSQNSVRQVAKLIASAQHPLVITSRAGKQMQAVQFLSNLADAWALPVVEFRPRYLSLSNQHPMHAGYEVEPWLDHADLILVLDSDVPWIPSQREPRDGIPIVHVSSDPLFTDYPTHGFRSSISIQATPLDFLKSLQQALAHEVPNTVSLQKRRALITTNRESRIQQQSQAWLAAQDQQLPNMATASYVLGLGLNAQKHPFILVNEYSLVPAAINLYTPGSYFGSSPVGGLGWGLPAAMGIKLARPETLVVAVVGDGSYEFSNPLACHHAAAMHDIAFLIIVLNNAGYGAVRRATESMYPEGIAVKKGMPLVSLQPQPAFEDVIKTCAGWGEKVLSLADFPAALERAIEQVTVNKRQALLNVMCS